MPLIVKHWRLVKNGVHSEQNPSGYVLKRKAQVSEDESICSHGGATHVQIVNNKGELLKEGVAFCHPKENFCYKEGKRYALIHAKQGMPSDYRPAVVDWVDIPEELKKFI